MDRLKAAQTNEGVSHCTDRNFKDSVQARVLADPAFRDALLREGVECMLGGNVDAGKTIPRDHIKATVGFERLGAETGTAPKSLVPLEPYRCDPSG